MRTIRSRVLDRSRCRCAHGQYCSPAIVIDVVMVVVMVVVMTAHLGNDVVRVVHPRMRVAQVLMHVPVRNRHRGRREAREQRGNQRDRAEEGGPAHARKYHPNPRVPSTAAVAPMAWR